MVLLRPAAEIVSAGLAGERRLAPGVRGELRFIAGYLDSGRGQVGEGRSACCGGVAGWLGNPLAGSGARFARDGLGKIIIASGGHAAFAVAGHNAGGESEDGRLNAACSEF